MVDVHQRAGVLVGVDGSAGSEGALRWAYVAAALEGRRVSALLAWSPYGQPRNVYQAATTADHEGLTRAAAEILDRSVDQVPMSDPRVGVIRTVVDADPVLALLQAGEHATMIVVGSRGHGPLTRALTGSVSQKLVHHAKVPVIVVRAARIGEPGDRRPVVVGIDGSPDSLAALRWAARQASLREVPLRLIHAYGLRRPYSDVLETVYPSLRERARRLLDEVVGAESWAGFDVAVTTEAVADTPARALLREAASAQLLTTGARGQGGFTDLLLGSISHQCVMHAACPVAVVRA